jgi:hypothetical protein
MKATVVFAMSSSRQIKDFPQPQPGPGQALVKMRASGIWGTAASAGGCGWASGFRVRVERSWEALAG